MTTQQGIANNANLGMPACLSVCLPLSLPPSQGTLGLPRKANRERAAQQSSGKEASFQQLDPGDMIHRTVFPGSALHPLQNEMPTNHQGATNYATPPPPTHVIKRDSGTQLPTHPPAGDQALLPSLASWGIWQALPITNDLIRRKVFLVSLVNAFGSEIARNVWPDQGGQL